MLDCDYKMSLLLQCLHKHLHSCLNNSIPETVLPVNYTKIISTNRCITRALQVVVCSSSGILYIRI